MNIVLSLLVACAFCAAIAQSFVAVAMPPVEKNYWTTTAGRIKKLEAKPHSQSASDTENREQLELAYWANGQQDEAQKLLDKDWANYGVMQSPDGMVKYRRQGALLGNLMLDDCAFKQAADCFKALHSRDTEGKPEGVSSGADLNNRGVAFQMLAAQTTDTTRRSDYLRQATENYQSAEKIFRDKKSEDALRNNLINQFGLLHDMDNGRKAESIFAEIKKLDHRPESDLRELVLQQQ